MERERREREREEEEEERKKENRVGMSAFLLYSASPAKCHYRQDADEKSLGVGTAGDVIFRLLREDYREIPRGKF